MQEYLLTIRSHMKKLTKQIVFNHPVATRCLLNKCICLYINLRSVYLSDCRSCPPLPEDQSWNVRYQIIAHYSEKVGIMMLRMYIQ